MSNWTTESELVGKRVVCCAFYGEEFTGIVIAVHKSRDLIKVRDEESEETGELLIGNQWEEIN